MAHSTNQVIQVPTDKSNYVTNRPYRKKIDDAVIDFVNGFTKVKDFVTALNIELLLELSKPENVRRKFLLDLLGNILVSAISTFDFDLYYVYVKRLYSRNADVLIRDFYNQALAHNEDSASNLLRQLSEQAFHAEKDTVRGVLLQLIKELLPSVNTGSLEVQTCFQSLVEAYITKTVDKEPSKPEDWARPTEVHKCYSYGCKVCPELNAFLKDSEAKEKTIAVTADDKRHISWHFGYLDTKNGSCEGEVSLTKTLKGWEKCHGNWESDVKAAQEKLQGLPLEALKQALSDKYDTLMALDPIRLDRSTAQAPDKAQLPSRSKRPRSEDANNTAPVRTSKRARHGGEQTEG